MGDGGRCGDRQRGGHFGHGAVAHGDQIDVGVAAERFGVGTPVASGQGGDGTAPFRIAGEELEEFQAASGDGQGQGLCQVSASDNDDSFHLFYS